MAQITLRDGTTITGRLTTDNLFLADDGRCFDHFAEGWLDLSTAQMVARMLDDDGQRFETEDGTEFDTLMAQYGAQVTYANRIGDALHYTFEPGTRSGWYPSDPINYRFPDGSAIIAIGGGWDLEGGEGPFSWGV